MAFSENSDNNEFKSSLVLGSASTILDLLRHEVNQAIGTDRTLKRLEKTIMHPEILKNLSFEQIMAYMDRLMRREEKGKEFIIDFYRVTSKSQDIQQALKQCIISETSTVDESGNLIESEEDFKQKLINKLDEVLIQEQEEING